jgi:hypothetical protein
VTDDGEPDERPEVTRREAVAGASGLLTGVGAFRAIDNVLLGYGETGRGTNVLEQDLADLVTARLSLGYDERVNGHRIRITPDAIEVGTASGGRRLATTGDARAAARELDEDRGLDGRLASLYADVRAFRAGDVRVSFSQPAAFFERVRRSDTRPDTVAAIRGHRDRVVAPGVVEAFTGADTTRPERVVEALVGAFRERAAYDFTRYAAGSVEDNVIFGLADLRQHFEQDVSFDAMLAREAETGLFCYEFVARSREALEAVPPWAQRVPVATAYVRDDRHKHAYTGVAAAIRVDGELVVPMTFVDYTHTTLYDALDLTGIMGRGLAAYDDRHRATDVFW